MKLNQKSKDEIMKLCGDLLSNVSFILRNCLDEDSTYNTFEDVKTFSRGCIFKCQDIHEIATNESNYKEIA